MNVLGAKRFLVLKINNELLLVTVFEADSEWIIVAGCDER